jgi:hypothetical protein
VAGERAREKIRDGIKDQNRSNEEQTREKQVGIKANGERAREKQVGIKANGERAKEKKN